MKLKSCILADGDVDKSCVVVEVYGDVAQNCACKGSSPKSPKSNGQVVQQDLGKLGKQLQSHGDAISNFG